MNEETTVNPTDYSRQQKEITSKVNHALLLLGDEGKGKHNVILKYAFQNKEATVKELVQVAQELPVDTVYLNQQKVTDVVKQLLTKYGGELHGPEKAQLNQKLMSIAWMFQRSSIPLTLEVVEAKYLETI